ncbi:MAG: hypothetical protein Homavirus29_6, partial [Homavirus sp.]
MYELESIQFALSRYLYDGSPYRLLNHHYHNGKFDDSITNDILTYSVEYNSINQNSLFAYKYDYIIHLIKNYNIDINYIDEDGYAPIHHVIDNKNIPLLKYLLDNNVVLFDENNKLFTTN